jgi:hypothetical protein
MSIATLKKKTMYKYNNSSVGHTQFSLNGGYRSQGFVGQTSLSRSLIKTPMKGNVIRGHGGIDGTYPQHVNFTSDITSLNDSTQIKNSVVSSDGMVKTKYKWIKRPLPFSVIKPKKIDSCKFSIIKDKIVDSCSNLRITTNRPSVVTDTPIINCRTWIGSTQVINCSKKIGTTTIGTKISNGISC